MGQVLYEATSFVYSRMYPMAAMAVIYLILTPYWTKRMYNDPRPRYVKQRVAFEKKNINFVLIMTIVSIVFLLFILLVVGFEILEQVDMYNKAVKAYQQGNYEVVEGYVENFGPMPNRGERSEAFDINGVSFFYAEYDHMQGYNQIRSSGGVITGDGQHLRIGYVYYNKHYGNIIVYIEELD